MTRRVVPAPAPKRVPLPRTPAGSVLRAWLNAFNSADNARMDAYYRRYALLPSAAGELPFRHRVGGFDLVGIERSEPRRVQFVLQERNRPRRTYGVLQIAEEENGRVTAFQLWPLGADEFPTTFGIDAATRARVVAGAIAGLDSFYVFPEMAKRMSDALRARLARGAYETETNGIAFALRLRQELRDISRDKHLHVDYNPGTLPALPPLGAEPPRQSPEDSARERERMERTNCGFRKAVQLAGNVGYLRFDRFATPEFCEPTVAAAMTFLAGTRALIVDLRANGGGSPDMVALVASYLFDRSTHLSDLWTRYTGTTEEFWTRDSVRGRRFGGEKPVFVLTSARTISAAEGFAYDLKVLKRATVVGETTAGAAHHVWPHQIDAHFFIGVPFARAVNPVTRGNWEGVGVEPDVKVPADNALMKVQELLRDRARP